MFNCPVDRAARCRFAVPVYTCSKRKRREQSRKSLRLTVRANLDSRLADCRGQGQPLVGSWQLQRTTTAKCLAWNTGHASTQKRTRHRRMHLVRTAADTPKILSNRNSCSAVPKFPTIAAFCFTANDPLALVFAKLLPFQWGAGWNTCILLIVRMWVLLNGRISSL